VTVSNVQWITLDDGQGSCPKHAELCTRINLDISASVGFIEKKSAYACLDDEDAASKRPLLCTSGHGVTSGRHEP